MLRTRQFSTLSLIWDVVSAAGSRGIPFLPLFLKRWFFQEESLLLTVAEMTYNLK